VSFSCWPLVMPVPHLDGSWQVITPPDMAQPWLVSLGEQGFALLTGRWRTLQHITASPGKIGDIARAALVLTHFEHGCIT
jgi:hypothetical protein